MTRRNVVVDAEGSSSRDAARVVVVDRRRLTVTIVVGRRVVDVVVDAVVDAVDARARGTAVVARDAVAPTRPRASVIAAPSARSSDAAPE